jgi:hypothetical protein
MATTAILTKLTAVGVVFSVAGVAVLESAFENVICMTILASNLSMFTN